MNRRNRTRLFPHGHSHLRTGKRFGVALLLAFIILSLPRAGAERREQRREGDAAATLAIVGATIVDGTGRAPFRGSVVVRGERIVAVGPDANVPAGARVIRADGQTLLPGLFDLHTHLPYATAPNINADWPKNLKAYLYCGVTTVVDFGTYPETFEPMRRLIREGVVESPRIHLAARLSTPGGHGAEGGRSHLFTLEVQTPREARAAVRRVLPYKPDVIKVFTDGWRYGTAPDMSSMNEETLAAIVDEAHRNGIEVLTHTVTLERAKLAARAGVDVLAHGVGDREVDDELIRIMRAKNTTLVSTLAVYEPRGRDILSPLLQTVLEPAVRDQIKPALTAPRPQDDAERAPVPQLPAKPSAGAEAEEPARGDQAARTRRWQNLLHNVAALHVAGVRLGAGTDAGVTGTHHGWASLRELELLVRGGLTPMQAITAATLDSAKALHVDAELGSIAAGKLADLVLVDGAPQEKITDIERVARVFLNGRELDRERLARDIASAQQTPIPAPKMGSEVDDFEREATGSGGGVTAGKSALPGGGLPGGVGGDAPRSTLGTLWVDSTDNGLDHSEVIYGRTTRKGRDHALSVLARMSVAERPYVRVSVPLAPGAVEPADVSGWRGVSFDVRGDGGQYRLVVPTRAARDSVSFQTPFKADGKWETIRIDFASLKQEKTERPSVWTGTDALMLTFEIARPTGELGWLELDNVRFYK